MRAGPGHLLLQLGVYSAQGYGSAMTKAFTKATGIAVKLDDNSTGPLLTQIEASKNNPQLGPALGGRCRNPRPRSRVTSTPSTSARTPALPASRPGETVGLRLNPAGCHVFPC
jgi:hypothetical protein